MSTFSFIRCRDLHSELGCAATTTTTSAATTTTRAPLTTTTEPCVLVVLMVILSCFRSVHVHWSPIRYVIHMNTFSFIRCRDLPLGTWVCNHNDDDGSSDDDNNSNTNDDDRTMCIASTYDSFLLSNGVCNISLQEPKTDRYYRIFLFVALHVLRMFVYIGFRSVMLYI